jgi:hypothetical protein
MKCSAVDCKKEAVTKDLRLCKTHAKEANIPGFKKSHTKRQTYTNIVQFDERGYPACEKHGAMNSVNKEGTLWRCTTCGAAIDFKTKENCEYWLKVFEGKTKLDFTSKAPADVLAELFTNAWLISAYASDAWRLIIIGRADLPQGIIKLLKKTSNNLVQICNNLSTDLPQLKADQDLKKLKRIAWLLGGTDGESGTTQEYAEEALKLVQSLLS